MKIFLERRKKMGLHEDDIDTLVEIGLTSTQARTYLVLTNLGKANVRTIWKNSGVARQDIYRILTELLEKGIIEKIIATPTEYKAIPLQDALSILLGQKARKYKEIGRKAHALINRMTNDHQKTKISKDYNFMLITAKKAKTRWIDRSQYNLKESIYVLDSWESYRRVVAAYADNCMQNLMKKVEHRVITNKPRTGEAMPDVINTLKETGNFQLRQISERPPTSIVIEDGKRVVIIVEETKYMPEAPSLVSDNPQFVAAVQNYFNLLWSQATET
ncbi:MAG: helix-turn-helix domain-containing protein [Candidatus Bathyarchaeota archaeon]|nr:helix-turn-helix domain-containing protein [Candidatus Bathyarchaeota archaeon]